MKAAYLCDAKRCIDLVYSKENQEKLAQMFDFYEGIYTKADSDKLKDVECLFSSWGFPEYTEEEIPDEFKTEALSEFKQCISKISIQIMNQILPVLKESACE